MSNKFALDTNVLIYLHDASDSTKRDRAIELMAQSPIISGQVVSEYINVLRRILNLPKNDLLKEVLLWLSLSEVVPVDIKTLKLAKRLISRYNFQIFDAIIVSTSIESDCDFLYSEDMQHNLKVDNKLTIVNPFI